MSSGGLLQKALEQQESQANSDGADLLDKIAMGEGVEGEIPSASGEPDSISFIPSSPKDIDLKKIFLALVIGGLLPTVMMMWFGVYLIPDAIPITIVTPLVTLVSLVGVWIYLGIGLPVQFKIGKIAGGGVAVVPAIIVAISYLSMLLVPIILGFYLLEICP